MVNGTVTDTKKIWMRVGIAAAVLVVVGLAWFLLLGNQTDVPNVVGMNSGDAVRTLQAAGLVLGVSTPAAEASEQPGTVVSENPAPGTKVKKGSPIDITVSAPAALIPVPDVKGKEASAAAAELKTAGLVAAQYSDYNAASPAGTVFGQVPQAGQQVPPGTSVALGVSLGPVPVSPTIPKVIGKTRDEATTALANAGFQSQLYEGYSDTVASGLVITQYPTSGTKTLAGSSVAIQVSKGQAPGPVSPNVTVPNVAGKPQAAAESMLKSAGLGVESYNVFSNSVPKGNVGGQLPAAGAKVEPGTVIGIAISDGASPAYVTVPNLVGMASSDATAALRALGLRAIVSPTYDTSHKAGTVIAQLPPAGSQVPPNSQVAIEVAGDTKPTPQ